MKPYVLYWFAMYLYIFMFISIFTQLNIFVDTSYKRNFTAGQYIACAEIMHMPEFEKQNIYVIYQPSKRVSGEFTIKQYIVP